MGFSASIHTQFYNVLKKLTKKAGSFIYEISIDSDKKTQKRIENRRCRTSPLTVHRTMCAQIPSSEHKPAQAAQPPRAQHVCVYVIWNECKTMCNKRRECAPINSASEALETLISTNSIRESGLLLDFPGKPPTLLVNARAKAGNEHHMI